MNGKRCVFRIGFAFLVWIVLCGFAFVKKPTAIAVSGKFANTRKPSPYLTLQIGSQGEEVYSLKVKLAELGFLPPSEVNDVYDEIAFSAVSLFQAFNGLEYTDGIAGNWTYGRLQSDELVGFHTITKSEKGSAVLLMQKRLINMSFLIALPDGVFGSYTEQAVQIFQLYNGLPTSGSPDLSTMLCLFSDSSRPFMVSSANNYGVEIKELRALLTGKNYVSQSDSMVFDNELFLGIKVYQLYNNQNITGEFDYNTIVKLLSKSGNGFRTLRVGTSGSDVLSIQRKLWELGYLEATPDGVYGSFTERAVSTFQFMNGYYDFDGAFGRWSSFTIVASPIGFSSVSKGSRGASVQNLQEYLSRKGYLSAKPDGIFGNQTDDAVRKFQLVNGLPLTGTADKELFRIITIRVGLSFRHLQTGDRGQDVLRVQKRLYELGYLIQEPDGVFGTYTRQALILFQAENGLEAFDGKFGIWSASRMSASNAAPYTDLSLGMTGNAVIVLQKYLAKYKYINVSADGIFGGVTQNGIRDLQLNYTLNETGVADRTSLLLLYTGNKMAMNKSAAELIRFGKQFLGTPYVYGGTSLTTGIDCSSFTQQCYAHIGISIPRTSYWQVNTGVAVSDNPSDWDPGDLIFYNVHGSIGHVVIYIGEGKILQSAQSQGGVVISEFDYNGNVPAAVRRHINP